MEQQHYDAVIIGSGQGGGPIATALAKAGRKTVIIEREHVGGTCVNEGCTPTKTMVASARVAYLARRGADYGVHTGAIQVDMTKVRERKRAIVESFRSSGEQSTEKTENLDLIMGEARFTRPHTIEIQLNKGGTQSITSDLIILNVGARSSPVKLDGIEGVPTLDSTSIMELDTVPEHLIIIGGGYIGLEFGQMFHRFGSKVTIIQRGAQLLGREDEDMAEAVADMLRQDGIDILLETKTLRVAKQGEQLTLTVENKDGEHTINGSHLLLAAGRTPNSDSLDLAAAGVATDDKGFITVNERLETNVAGIYAIGDVKGGPAFTHISYDDFRILRTNLLENGSATTADRMVPYTAFIDPQFGRVGLSEQEARKQGRSIKVAKLPMEYVARALEVDETRGVMKAIVDADTKQILGCAIFGLEGGEIMSMIQIAMMGKLPYTVLRDATIAHPTLAESLNNLFTSLDE